MRVGKIRRPSGTRVRPWRTTSWELFGRGLPSKRIEPESAAFAPAIVLRRVDFPAPFAPITATISPAPTRSETPDRALIPP